MNTQKIFEDGFYQNLFPSGGEGRSERTSKMEVDQLTRLADRVFSRRRSPEGGGIHLLRQLF